MAAAVLAASAAWAIAAPPVAAQEGSPEPSEEVGDTPEPVLGEPVCTLTDPRLTEVSGLVATDDGYIAVNDSQDFVDRKPIFLLDSACNVVDQIPFPTPPLDPEDLALDRERQILWAGDVGDNVAGGLATGGSTRPTVALWRVDLSGGDRTPVIHRFVYPDGQARDAEALVLDGDGTPIIITKTVATAELYRPTDFVPGNPPEQAVPLEKLGEFTPPETTTEHYLSALSIAGRRVVTGGANSPDGTKVVLRTYTDAFEFDVADGDVVAAITEGEPRVTPFAPQIAEIQGEALTYSPDGTHFLTISDAPPSEMDLPEPFVPTILRYTPVEPPPPSPTAEPAPQEGGSSGGALLSSSLDKAMLAIGVVGVLGLAMVVAGVVGIVRARRRAAEEESANASVPGQTRGVVSVGATAPVVAAAAVPAAGAAVAGAAAAGAAATASAGTVYGGSARVPAPSPPAEDASATDWQPEAAEQPGVYRSQAGTYQSEYSGTTYGGTTYGGEEDAAYGGEYESYDDGEYPSEYYDDSGYDSANYGDYEGGVYHSGEEIDDYYDDPDYSYEFRDPGPDRY